VGKNPTRKVCSARGCGLLACDLAGKGGPNLTTYMTSPVKKLKSSSYHLSLRTGRPRNPMLANPSFRLVYPLQAPIGMLALFPVPTTATEDFNKGAYTADA